MAIGRAESPRRPPGRPRGLAHRPGRSGTQAYGGEPGRSVGVARPARSLGDRHPTGKPCRGSGGPRGAAPGPPVPRPGPSVAPNSLPRSNGVSRGKPRGTPGVSSGLNREAFARKRFGVWNPPCATGPRCRTGCARNSGYNPPAHPVHSAGGCRCPLCATNGSGANPRGDAGIRPRHRIPGPTGQPATKSPS